MDCGEARRRGANTPVVPHTHSLYHIPQQGRRCQPPGDRRARRDPACIRGVCTYVLLSSGSGSGLCSSETSSQSAPTALCGVSEFRESALLLLLLLCVTCQLLLLRTKTNIHRVSNKLWHARASGTRRRARSWGHVSSQRSRVDDLEHTAHPCAKCSWPHRRPCP